MNTEILQALQERETDLKNLERTLDTITRINENKISQIIIQDIILKTK